MSMIFSSRIKITVGYFADFTVDCLRSVLALCVPVYNLRYRSKCSLDSMLQAMHVCVCVCVDVQLVPTLLCSSW